MLPVTEGLDVLARGTDGELGARPGAAAGRAGRLRGSTSSKDRRQWSVVALPPGYLARRPAEPGRSTRSTGTRFETRRGSSRRRNPLRPGGTRPWPPGFRAPTSSRGRRQPVALAWTGSAGWVIGRSTEEHAAVLEGRAGDFLAGGDLLEEGPHRRVHARGGRGPGLPTRSTETTVQSGGGSGPGPPGHQADPTSALPSGRCSRVIVQRAEVSCGFHGHGGYIMRVIHTADWQIGKPFARVGDPYKRSLLQQARIEAVGVSAHRVPRRTRSWSWSRATCSTRPARTGPRSRPPVGPSARYLCRWWRSQATTTTAARAASGSRSSSGGNVRLWLPT